MGKKKPETVIQDWCEFHLDEGVSRWSADSALQGSARTSRGSHVYAGEGIIATLKDAGYKIVPDRTKGSKK